MIVHEKRLLAHDSHGIPCLICYFWKSSKIWNCRLLQIIGGALWVNNISKWADHENSVRDGRSWQRFLFILFFIHQRIPQRAGHTDSLEKQMNLLGSHCIVFLSHLWFSRGLCYPSPPPTLWIRAWEDTKKTSLVVMDATMRSFLSLKRTPLMATRDWMWISIFSFWYKWHRLWLITFLGLKNDHHTYWHPLLLSLYRAI